jgi:inosine-uridine nucleoside N-ribohydrolase
MNVLFDMETGDPDDLITLLMLLANPDVQLRGITCWQGSPIQIGLINHVLKLANVDIPVGGLNEPEPTELSPYYTDVVGKWSAAMATQTPTEVFKQVLKSYPDTKFLTGAPLTNLGEFVSNNPEVITSMTTQGGYLGALVAEPLDKFKGKKSIRTYNLTNDTDAFTKVNYSDKIEKLTFVTKDLCHGFMYTPEMHKNVVFGETPVQQLLKSCLERYALSGKSKAMHDPLAMLYMLYPEIGQTKQIEMSFVVDAKGHSVFSSVEGSGTRSGLVSYDKEKAWAKFTQLCQIQHKTKLRL